MSGPRVVTALPPEPQRHTCIGAECFSSPLNVSVSIGALKSGSHMSYKCHILSQQKANLGHLLLIELLKTTGSATICGFMQELNSSP